MLFVPQVINHVQPAISITTGDSGVPPLTYDQIRNSLGNQVYKVDGLYLYSTNMNQVLNVIQYNLFDGNGNQNYTSIAPTVDPYQFSGSIVVDITKYVTDFILNGNSSLSTTILPNASLQIQLFTNRVTNQFGEEVKRFKEMEWMAHKPDFFKSYGDVDSIEYTDVKIENTLKVGAPTAAGAGDGKKDDNCDYCYLFLVAGLSLGLYFYNKK